MLAYNRVSFQKKSNRVSFQKSTSSNHSTNGCNSSENEEKDGRKKCTEAEENQHDSTGSSSFWRKSDLIRQKALGQKTK